MKTTFRKTVRIAAAFALVLTASFANKATAQSDTGKKEAAAKECEKHSQGGFAPEWVTGQDKLTTDCPEVRVGIGTSYPAAKLDVRGVGYFSKRVGIGTATPSNELEVLGTGYVSKRLGLGTSSPQQTLDVQGNSALRGDIMGYRTGTGVFSIFSNTDGTDGSYIRMYPNSGTKPGNVSLVASGGGTASIDFFSWDGTAHQLNMTVNAEGVGVGTAYIPNGYAMAVNGKIICEEARVRLSGDWPDYVFAEDYELLPLAELEVYIKTNKHLPGVPSATEVGESADIGSTVTVLLEKIEEQSLYLIQQQKQIEALQQKVELLQGQLPTTSQ